MNRPDHSKKLKEKFGDDFFKDIRKQVKNPGFKGNPEMARRAANKRWHNEKTPKEEDSQAVS